MVGGGVGGAGVGVFVGATDGLNTCSFLTMRVHGAEWFEAEWFDEAQCTYPEGFDAPCDEAAKNCGGKIVLVWRTDVRVYENSRTCCNFMLNKLWCSG
jgi:hypothetical protein